MVQPSYSINYLINLKNENRRKLDSFYIGPYKITTITEPNCELQHVDFDGKFTEHNKRVIKSKTKLYAFV